MGFNRGVCQSQVVPSSTTSGWGAGSSAGLSRSAAELKDLFAGNGMVGFVAKERVDGKLVLPEAVQLLTIKGDSASK
jgi:hypothetical protein